ncbi:kinase-like domain-containing protein, partial [Thelephora terrestris]
MWKRLRHPNIVPLVGVTRTPLQFVSEWMPNGTVTGYLCENPGANRIALLLDVAEGLAFLHGRSMAHGDLKGPNILIDYNGRARLTDFGFTSVVRRLDSVLITQVQGYSPGWAAPEIFVEGDRNTREADVFAFAMVIIEVFTGRRPFKMFTTEVTISKIMGGERPDRPQDPGLTDAVWDVTLHCWDQDPAQRPAMTSVVGTLREVKRQTYGIPHRRDLLLNSGCLESSASSLRRNSSISKTWTLSRRLTFAVCEMQILPLSEAA